MNDSAPKSKREWLQNIEEYGFLKNLAAILIKRAKTILVNDRTQTWESICKKACGKHFKYQYIEGHVLRITDRATKRHFDKRLPSIDTIQGKLTQLIAPAA